MSDFLSRLVERTFGLITVAQPVIGSIFSPEFSMNDADSLLETNIYGPTTDSESLIDLSNVSIDNSERTVSVPKRDNRQILNLRNLLINDNLETSYQKEEMDRKTDDILGIGSHNVGLSISGHTSVSRHIYNIEPLKKNNSDNSAYPESRTLSQRNEQNNRDLYSLPPELAQDNKNIYKTNSDTLELVEPEPVHMKRQNNQAIMTLIPKTLIMPAEMNQDNKPLYKTDSKTLDLVEPEQLYMKSRNNRDPLAPISKSVLFTEQSQNSDIVSLKQSQPSSLNHVGIKSNQDFKQNIVLKPEFPFNNGPTTYISSESGENYSLHNKPFVGNSENPEKTFLEQMSNSSPVSVNPGYQNVKLKNVKLDVVLESELQYMNDSAAKYTGITKPGENYSLHNKPFTDNPDYSVGKIILEQSLNSSLESESPVGLNKDESIQRSIKQVLKSDFYHPGHLHPNTGHLHPNTIVPKTPNLQYSKQVNTQQASALSEQMSNMLIEHRAFEPQSPTTPVIKVTIGRIEVRAIKPSIEIQPQLPLSKQYPILSLDDYLKQQNR